MPTADDSHNYETGAPLPEGCDGPPSPPAWTFTASYSGAGTLTVSRNNTTKVINYDAAFGAGGVAGSTVNLPQGSFTGLTPGRSYRLAFEWASGEGAFAPYPLGASTSSNVLGASANLSNFTLGARRAVFELYVPSDASVGYTPINVNVVPVTLWGIWSNPSHLTIAGTWADPELIV